MKIVKFYVCDVALFLLSIGFIKLYDAFLYEYMDFWFEGLAYILTTASIVIGVGASISFIFQKLCKGKFEFYKSFKYTFIVIAILSGLAGVILFACACFISVDDWDALGYCVLSAIGFIISVISLVALFVYFIVREVNSERSKKNDSKRDVE